MRILVTNCNTSAAITDVIAAEAVSAARTGTQISVRAPRWGVESAEGWYDSYLSAASVIDLVQTEGAGYDAIVLAGFGEHGREAIRELTQIPVVDITEAAVAIAVSLGQRYAILTSLSRTRSQILASLRTSPLGADACAAILAIDRPVLELAADHKQAVALLDSVGQQALAAGADTVILGCAGMASLGPELSQLLGVPVIDGVAAGVALAESLVSLGLSTSKRGYPAPLSKTRPTIADTGVCSPVDASARENVEHYIEQMSAVHVTGRQ